jgi:hypothetical protein
VKKSNAPAQFYNPLFAWTMLGLQATEMMAASAHVIHHRTRRKNSPAQLFEMGNEKMQAAIESSHAMARQWMRLQRNPGADFFHQWAAMLASGMKPYHSRALQNARRASRR